MSTWGKTLSDSRSAYASLREHFLKNIENPDDLSADDPLTGTETVSETRTPALRPVGRRRRSRLTFH